MCIEFLKINTPVYNRITDFDKEGANTPKREFKTSPTEATITIQEANIANRKIVASKKLAGWNDRRFQCVKERVECEESVEGKCMKHRQIYDGDRRSQGETKLQRNSRKHLTDGLSIGRVNSSSHTELKSLYILYCQVKVSEN